MEKNIGRNAHEGSSAQRQPQRTRLHPYTALCEVARALEESGVETETLWIGNRAVRGCIGCGGCAKTADAAASSRMIWSTPRWIGCRPATVWWSARRFITRPRAAASPLFWIACSTPAAASFARRSARQFAARRAGTTSTLDQLSKYFTICGMPIAPSQYWPMVHGNTPEDVLRGRGRLADHAHVGEKYGVYDPRLCPLRAKTGCFRPKWRSQRSARISSVDRLYSIRRMKRPKVSRCRKFFSEFF